ncbi:FAD-dependent oxidoreductase [Bradyrhizobium lablabi]|uniref:hydroxysqualene dehydroxylase n=1 Tax=Bradyrhizobium lablabi TaxID=722472 RepID=UPI001BA8FD23|nr:FAD-dependent oxidoreductase [Bradyrhizobium lablabi]MBR0693579.1 FAD-dependent oxidoreductase [Bradyrhizobium lablabi]
MTNKVVVLGGGVAGLSAAHELVERGFTVEVYEKALTLGGKAQSNTYAVGGPGKPLPGEHGFRFFPGFYQHLPDTMSRIPFSASNVLNNLVTAKQTGVAQETKPLFVFLTYIPKTLQDWLMVLQDWFDRAELGLKSGEAEFFVACLLDFMSTCTKRRLAKLEYKKWWDYVDAPSHSIQYQKLCAAGLTRSLVAMKAEEASTRTVGTILVQMMMAMTSQAATMDRVLNAPTNDAWIKPWTDYLSAQGVTFHVGHDVQSLQFDGSRITGVTVQTSSGSQTVTGDYYLAAFPVEVAQNLFTPLLGSAPSLQRIVNLRTEWMNGIQFYLLRDVKCCAGHVICADSSWAITCISQPQFWSGVDMTKFADGSIAGIMSIDISDWDTPGTKTTTKTARQCTSASEVAAETWAQLFDHLSATSQPLMPSDQKYWFLDPSITFPVTTNSQPLLVNTVGSWVDRPDATTEIPNLFLASDYVRTNTDLATMEGANEAARRAVNGILLASNSAAAPCGVWPFNEPAIFDPLKQIDEWLFDHHLPNPGFKILRLMAGL